MKSPAAVQSVNCKSCGTGLDLLGGGRVQMVVCGTCGAELDANRAYQVARKHVNEKRSQSPFQIGMKARFWDVDFTIIGTVGHIETYRGLSWDWVDHQLYSPTHGYAWLTVEEGHYTFTRRYRKASRPFWVSEREIETSENRPHLTVDGQSFVYHESGRSKICYLEGEFTWHPKIGDRLFSVFFRPAVSGTVGYSLSRPIDDNGQVYGERELEQTTYLTPDALSDAFGGKVEFSVSAAGHPLRPQPPRPKLRIWSYLSGLFFLVTLIALFTIGDKSSQRLVKTFQVDQLPVEIPLQVEHPNLGVSVDMRGNMLNHWVWFDLDVSDPEDVPVFYAGREAGKYAGYSEGESWSEGNGSNRVQFIPKMKGQYTLELGISEQGAWNDRTARGWYAATKVQVTVQQGRRNRFWMVLALVFFAIGTLPYPIARWLHGAANRSGSDWDDD